MTDNWSIEPAAGRREWMDATPEKFAYRCLPLVMANQAGWILRNPLNFIVNWTGSIEKTGIELWFPDGEGRNKGQVRTHFGSGIITFSLPWLFRTEPGYGLWVRGPTNVPRHGVAPLDGIVETDWAPYTFTMNWRITRPNSQIEFKRGEPICHIVPFPLSLLESIEPEICRIESDPQLQADFNAFNSGRNETLKKLAQTNVSSFEMNYMRGHKPDGTPVSEHRKAFKLREFTPPPAP